MELCLPVTSKEFQAAVNLKKNCPFEIKSLSGTIFKFLLQNICKIVESGVEYVENTF